MKAALAKAGGPKTHSGFPLYISPHIHAHTYKHHELLLCKGGLCSLFDGACPHQV